MTYRIKHVGINNETGQQARALADELCEVLGLEQISESSSSIFAGEIFEVMKHSNRGIHGHLALQTEDVEAAMAELAGKGITFCENTIRRDKDGKIIFVYLQQQFGGFAIHLTT